MDKHKILTLVLVGLWVIFIAFFVVLYLVHAFNITLNTTTNFYINLYGIIPLIGGIYGLRLSWRWGGFKSAIGNAIFFLSLGLITWAIGQGMWSYYNIVGVEIPYPSLADIPFMLSLPLWAIGAAFLSFATGANLGLRKIGGKLFMIITPIIASVFSYYFLVVVARQGVISTYDGIATTFTDLTYVLGDVLVLVIITLVFGLSYKYLGGRYKTAIYLILMGFLIGYVADFLFVYDVTFEKYFNGSLSDMLYVTDMVFLSIGVAGFTLPDYKNKNFSIITQSAAGTLTIFHQMIIKIIKKQESIIGLSAWYEANNVAGFTVDRNNSLVSFFGDGKEAVDRLVAHYEKIFGKASRGVCREGVQDLIVGLPVGEVPLSLVS